MTAITSCGRCRGVPAAAHLAGVGDQLPGAAVPVRQLQRGGPVGAVESDVEAAALPIGQGPRDQPRLVGPVSRVGLDSMPCYRAAIHVGAPP